MPSGLARLTARLRAQWSERRTVRRVTANSLWLAADNLFRLALAFVVGAWVTRHLGPAKLGTLSAAVAFSAPFMAIVSLGINGLVVRDLTREPENEGAILGTALALKLTGAALGITLGASVAFVARGADLVFLMIVLTLAGSLFQATEVVDLWFQGRGISRVPAWIRSVAAIAVNLVKVGLILVEAPLPFFAATTGLELAFCALGWSLAYVRRSAQELRWSFRASYAKRLLAQTWPVACAGIAVQIQAQFDQVLLARLRSAEEVGYYVAALRMVTIWSFLPTALATAAAPEVARAWGAEPGLFERRMRDLYRAVLVVGVASSGLVALFATELVALVFGARFADSAAILPMLGVRLVLTNLGVARGLFITNEGLFVHAMWTAVAGAAVNLGLNLLLIPGWGTAGCVAASLVSFTFTTLLLDLLHPGARRNLGTIAAALGLRRLEGR